ncbi:MucBP domain-containing protein [Lactococcus garvieae]|uniref:mucin-binding protein n=1 Tax=Lactococcus garvieae TaxID=1363 RepID=UPI0032433605
MSQKQSQKLKHSVLALTSCAALLMVAQTGSDVYAQVKDNAQEPKQTQHRIPYFSPSILDDFTSKNGTAEDPTKTSVSRTSDGFTVDNPTDQVKSFEMKWIQDLSKISVDTSTAFTISTPFEMAVELNSPLRKGESVEIPLSMQGKIFNTQGEANPSSEPNIGQNNGNYMVSDNKDFSYDYNKNTGMLKITALTDANHTQFSGMTYFDHSNWIPLPLTMNPYPLPGGLTGNYGQKGSGGAITVSMAGQTTTETVTNLQETNFSNALVPFSEDTISKGTRTSERTAPASNNFVHALQGVIGQTHKGSGTTGNVLDGSVDHYTVKPGANTKASEKAKADPWQFLRFEMFIPIGSNTQTHRPINSIVLGSNPTQTPALKNIFKNLKYDAATDVFTFDLSKNASDYEKMADELLSDPNFERKDIEWVKSYLLETAQSGNPELNASVLHLYFTAPESYVPINYNNKTTVTASVTNSKSNKKADVTMITNPVTAGEGLATKAGIISQYVDAATGEPLADGQSVEALESGDSYDSQPKAIEGWAYTTTNDKAVTDLLGVDNIIPAQGTVSDAMIGSYHNIVHAYTNIGSVTAHYVDTEGNSLAPDKKVLGKDKTNPEGLEAEEIENYQLVQSERIPQFEAGVDKEITFVYDNKAQLTTTVVDVTEDKELQGITPFLETELGQENNAQENKDKLDALVKSYTDKGYVLEEIVNGDLKPTDSLEGYNIEIRLSHAKNTQVVPGVNAQNKVEDKVVTQTVTYSGAEDKTPEDNVQTFTFTATVEQTLDAVTNEVISEADPFWSEAQTSKFVKTPVIEGYTANDPFVEELEYTHESEDAIIPIEYHPEATDGKDGNNGKDGSNGKDGNNAKEATAEPKAEAKQTEAKTALADTGSGLGAPLYIALATLGLGILSFFGIKRFLKKDVKDEK